MGFFKVGSGIAVMALLVGGIVPSSAAASEEPRLGAPTAFGQYLGVLAHSKIKQDQLVKLDLIPSRAQGNQISLKAVLVLYFGDFSSDEYVSYHYDHVTFNLLTGQLIFDQADQDLQVVVNRFTAGKIEGEVRSSLGGVIGALTLGLSEQITPSQPLIRKVEGEYRSASCNGQTEWITAHTFKSADDTSRVGNPFGGNEIRGQAASNDGGLCNGYNEPGKGAVCVTSMIGEGAYDFFRGKLNLRAHPKPFSCDVFGGTWSCSNGCTYQKVSPESLSQLTIEKGKPDFQIVPQNGSGTTPASIDGTYQGYVFHDRLSAYQDAVVQITTYQEIENGTSELKLSLTAGLYFGQAEESPLISYRFPAISLPNPFGIKDLVFSRSENDVDALLKITSFKDGVIEGEWHSLTFGSVGKFVVSNPSLAKIEISSQAKRITEPSGKFTDRNDWNLDLDVILDRTPPNTDNPFFPLTFTGFLRGIGGFTANLPVTGGSYDFYTGKMAIAYEENRVLVGTRSDSSCFELRVISKGFGHRYFGLTQRSFCE